MGVTELSDDQRRQIKEQQDVGSTTNLTFPFKSSTLLWTCERDASSQMQEMYDIIMKHKRTMAEMQIMWEKAVRDHQHEYDSDEEVDQQAGTWEHRLRKMEMEKTRGEAERGWGAATSAAHEQV